MQTPARVLSTTAAINHPLALLHQCMRQCQQLHSPSSRPSTTPVDQDGYHEEYRMTFKCTSSKFTKIRMYMYVRESHNNCTPRNWSTFLSLLTPLPPYFSHSLFASFYLDKCIKSRFLFSALPFKENKVIKDINLAPCAVLYLRLLICISLFPPSFSLSTPSESSNYSKVSTLQFEDIHRRHV